MTEYQKHMPGTFTWAELATTDPGAAKAFYGTVFGWTYEDQPMQEEMVYTLFNLRGRPVAACFQQIGSQVSQGIPPNWGLHVTVDDVDAMVDLIPDLDGDVVAGPFDVGPNGRMAAVMDPTGAILTLWQPVGHIGAAFLREPGAITWTELLTSDIEKCKVFYNGLFDWTSVTSAAPGGAEYVIFQMDGTNIAGMMSKPEDMASVPSNWMVYFGARDCKETMNIAKASGGTVLVPPMTVPGTGTFTIMQDPQGAVFGALEALPM